MSSIVEGKRYCVITLLIAHPHLLVWATSEWFLTAGATFRVGLACEGHWMQPMMVLIVYWWFAHVSVGGL